MCVSYRKLNAVTRPFRFSLRRCDDAILSIGEAKWFIKMDLHSGYWQIPVHQHSKSKLAFFGVKEKLTFAVMPMGALNAAPLFACMMKVLQKQWKELAHQRNIKGADSKVIIDDAITWHLDYHPLRVFRMCSHYIAEI